jgi:hypothetical protein
VKKVLTFKSGNVVFSSNYDKAIIEPRISQAILLYQTVKDLPVLPALASQLEEELIIRSLYREVAERTEKGKTYILNFGALSALG